MGDFKFQFDLPSERRVSKAKVLETWVPLEHNPELNALEKESVLFGEAVEELYLVKPAFLYVDAKLGINYIPGDDLDYYYTLAKLKKSPYLVLLGEEKKTPQMQSHLNNAQIGGTGNSYYLDIYLAPNFGGLKPKCILFEKTHLHVIPNTMVLFREAKGV